MFSESKRSVAGEVEAIRDVAPAWRRSPLGDNVDRDVEARFDLEDWALNDNWRRNTSARVPAWLYHPVTRFVLALIAALAIVAFAVGMIAVVYVIKSSLGIDLFAGHSFLHNWLYVR